MSFSEIGLITEELFLHWGWIDFVEILSRCDTINVV